mgnify:CR=1 FL=1
MRSERARHNKIIFSGTVGAGKSTAINALSDIPTVSTEAVASDETARLKRTTTVAMDYGVLNLPGGEKVMLYGTPGQGSAQHLTGELLKLEAGIDMAHVPLNDKELDVAIFCLSLMGSNFTDYLREAHRCLKFSGELHIWEPTSHFDDPPAFCRQLERLGFEPCLPVNEGPFIRIRTQKNGKKPDPNAVLSFRSAGGPA